MQKIIVYWRDIPSQVIVKKGRRREKSLLNARFQHAIDRAAMRARKHDSDAYMSEWKRVTTLLEDGGDPETIVRREAQRIEAAYPDDRLLQLIKNHGVTPL